MSPLQRQGSAAPGLTLVWLSAVAYLTQPYVTTNHFGKIPDQSGWDPTPCQADQAR